MVGTVGRDGLTLREVHRFGNQPVRAGGTWYWDILGIYREVLDGLRQAGPVHSIGVDSWAVDYGLLDGSGALLGKPVCYRDSRTDGVMDRVLKVVSAEESSRSSVCSSCRSTPGASSPLTWLRRRLHGPC